MLSRVPAEPLAIPWESVCPDNRRAAHGRGLRIITSQRYRTAKRNASIYAMQWWAGSPPLRGPVAFVARVYVPDERRRDASNLLKMLLDSLNGIVYDDDSQVEDGRWIRAGVDRENPRVEITVIPIAAGADDAVDVYVFGGLRARPIRSPDQLTLRGSNNGAREDRSEH